MKIKNILVKYKTLIFKLQLRDLKKKVMVGIFIIINVMQLVFNLKVNLICN